ncbi:alpha/beta hydrolase [Lichenicola sp.]|uniref:alpha/beta hydrolase n=1 Tax=Lichenicola sp. TaxID=2804529 RepID=UPI003AFFCF65
MPTKLTFLMGGLLSAVVAVPVQAARAATAACVPPNAAVPAGANTTDPAAPFYIDTSGLNLATTPPTRDPLNPKYPHATALADGTLPAPGSEGNFIIGPSHPAAPEATRQAGVPAGTIRSFTMTSTDGEIFRPGLVRDDAGGCRNQAVDTAATAPGDASDLHVSASHAGIWTRAVDVYVPAGYRPGTTLPFIVFGDGGPVSFFKETLLFTILDNLIHAGKLPPMAAIGIAAGGQDAQGSERGREYDTVSGAYAEWVEHEVLPRVERNAGVRLSHDPDARLTMGFSSSAAAAFTMAWTHPEWYHRVLGYSPTMVNQQWPHDPALPGGAWEYHSAWPGPKTTTLAITGGSIAPATMSDGAPLIPNTPTKPIRYWFEAGDRDLFYYVPAMADGMHDWTLANERMAQVLAAKGYHYQFVFSRNARHVDGATEAQTFPEALEWVWKGYKSVKGGS